MAKYNVPVKMVFECNVQVEAENRVLARKIAQQHFWTRIGSAGTSGDNRVIGYTYNPHPSDKKFERVTLHQTQKQEQ